MGKIYNLNIIDYTNSGIWSRQGFNTQYELFKISEWSYS